MIDSQASEILRHLESGKTIAPLEALREFGCWRLGARVYDLRQAGYDIETQMETDGHKSWARYSLAPATPSHRGCSDRTEDAQ